MPASPTVNPFLRPNETQFQRVCGSNPHVQRQHLLIATLGADTTWLGTVHAAQTLLEAGASVLSQHLDVSCFETAAKVFCAVPPDVLCEMQVCIQRLC